MSFDAEETTFDRESEEEPEELFPAVEAVAEPKESDCDTVFDILDTL